MDAAAFLYSSRLPIPIWLAISVLVAFLLPVVLTQDPNLCATKANGRYACPLLLHLHLQPRRRLRGQPAPPPGLPPGHGRRQRQLPQRHLRRGRGRRGHGVRPRHVPRGRRDAGLRRLPGGRGRRGGGDAMREPQGHGALVPAMPRALRQH
uniref:Uncharacterized protein n=1 Tax=Setaria viridis TaxID=4556 RepID=A0A4U6WE81_SETVI|nr:hypothetical protein SEVIR_1G233850v2 [Setaria viridis]